MSIGKKKVFDIGSSHGNYAFVKVKSGAQFLGIDQGLEILKIAKK